MQYMGGKSRVAKALTEVMLPMCAGRSGYLEPFVGGAWVLERMAPNFRYRAAGDGMADVALLWQAVQNGWVPPDTLTRDEWYALKVAEPSALRAFAGFGCSFGGRFFEGYAKNGRGDDFAGAAKRGIEKKRKSLSGVTIRHCDYSEWRFLASQVAVYCDPPYAGTKWYSGMKPWNPEAFWTQAEAWADHGALVFVSEYAAPKGWESIWSKSVKGSLSADTNTAAVTEHLFTWGGK